MALIVFPLLTIAAFGLAVLILVLIERRVESRGERAKVPCVNCGQSIHASALACPYCHAPVKEPRDVGLLGRPKDDSGRPRLAPVSAGRREAVPGLCHPVRPAGGQADLRGLRAPADGRPELRQGLHRLHRPAGAPGPASSASCWG